jgi:hypothetical protein
MKHYKFSEVRSSPCDQLQCFGVVATVRRNPQVTSVLSRYRKIRRTQQKLFIISHCN